MMEFIRQDPLNNASKIWTDFLPNDPYCQQSIKMGKEYAISRYTRCKDCVTNGDVKDRSILTYDDKICCVFHTYNTKPHLKYYGSMEGRFSSLLQKVGDNYALCCPESETKHHYVGLDQETNDIVAISYLEELIPNHICQIERVYRCQDRLTIFRHEVAKAKLFPDISTLYQQIHNIIITLVAQRFSLGSIVLDTVSITDKGILLNHLQQCSYDVDSHYRFGPMIDDYRVPYLDVFGIVRHSGNPSGSSQEPLPLIRYDKLPGSSQEPLPLIRSQRVNKKHHEVRHYFRINETNNAWVNTVSKYGLPVVGKSIDFYRLICAILIRYIHDGHDHETLTSLSWLKNMFLSTELTRFINRVVVIANYLKQHPEQHTSLDLIACLSDKEGPFALRCDVLDM